MQYLFLLQVSDMIYRHVNIQIQSVCMPPVRTDIRKGMFLQSAFGPAATRLAEKRCHDIAHPPPHMLKCTAPSWLSLFARDHLYASRLVGSSLTGTCISTSIAARPPGRVRPPHMPNTREEAGTSTISPRITIDAGDAGIVVPDCTVPPSRTPCARCSSLVSTSRLRWSRR